MIFEGVLLDTPIEIHKQCFHFSVSKITRKICEVAARKLSLMTCVNILLFGGFI